jgi:hypothetical protein
MINDQLQKKFFIEIFLIILAATIFSLGALWNGYPLIFHDSYSYIADGFTGQYQAVHPAAYTLFVKYTSLFGVSLFGPVFFQAILFSFLWRRLQVESTGNCSGFVFLTSVVLAALISGGAWILGLLVADAMTPIFVISSLLICLPTSRSKVMNLCIVVIFLLSGITHLSHLGIVGFVLGVLVIIKILLVFLKVFLKKPQFALTVNGLFKRWCLMTIAVFFCACSLNLSLGGSFKPAEALAPHILGRLAEAGSLGRLIQEDCKNTNYLFCHFWPKNQQIITAKQFIWEKNSPLFATKKQEDNKEYLQMIQGAVLKQPLAWVNASIKSTFTQLISFKLGDRIFSYLNNPWNSGAVGRFFPDEFELFRNARQQRSELFFIWPNILLYSSLAFFVICCFTPSVRKILFCTQLRKASWGGLGALIFFNALFCGVFTSGLLERYQARVIWLIPAYLGLLILCESKKKTQA